MDYVVLEEIDNSDEDETADTSQQSEKIKSTVRVTMTANDNSGYDDDANDNDDEDDDDNEDSGGSVSDAVNEGNYDFNSEEVQVTFCVLPNLVEHAGHGNVDIFIIDSFKQG